MRPAGRAGLGGVGGRRACCGCQPGTRLMLGFTSLRGKERIDGGVAERSGGAGLSAVRRWRTDGGDCAGAGGAARAMRAELDVIVDRLTVQPDAATRLRDSLEIGAGSGTRGGGGVGWKHRRILQRHRTNASNRRDRRPPVASPRLQPPVAMRDVRHPVPRRRAAAAQLQQPAGRLPGVRGVRQRHRHRHGRASCPIRRSRSATGRSRRGTRRPTPTSWRSCSRWRGDYGMPVDVPFRELTRRAPAARFARACRSGSSAG